MLITAILLNFWSKFAQSSIVSYFRVIFIVFYDYRKLLMSSFFTKFVKLDPDPHSEKLLDPINKPINNLNQITAHRREIEIESSSIFQQLTRREDGAFLSCLLSPLPILDFILFSVLRSWSRSRLEPPLWGRFRSRSRIF